MQFIPLSVQFSFVGLALSAIFVVFSQSCAVSTPSSQSNSRETMQNTRTQVNVQLNIVAGSYNQNGSEGIYGFSYDTSTNTFSEAELLAKAENPSYIDIQNNKLYVVNELGSGQLSTYERKQGHQLNLLTSVATNGASPCYVSSSPDHKHVATANYMGGNISVFIVDDNGIPKPQPQILQHIGRGPNKSRQEAAHAHWVQWTPDQSLLYAVDLGIDEIKVYPFDSVTGKVGLGITALQLAPGDGPRHMVFHPSKSMVYILNELSNSITVAEKHKSGELRPIQQLDTLPTDFKQHSQGGHIYITEDGKTLYASNRGHNSIAVFSIGDNGKLTLLETESTRGSWPRHFLVVEEFGLILVANQESNNVVALKIGTDGTLSSLDAQLMLPQITFLGRL